ncbi:cbb3-type cytochrome oxidase assembly protein CcoS [Shewanella sp. GXUN23E]|uniref:cbb3-type cytochrome oxidase assembly protein CcoS n=1 Tax=Shewanella sp. GXUN23E TaxID=3422498 RepID=UPI003D7C61D2
MSIIYVLIPIAMLFVLIAFGIFFWAVKNDQFEDLEKHSASILFDEDQPQPPTVDDNQQQDGKS